MLRNIRGGPGGGRHSEKAGYAGLSQCSPSFLGRHPGESRDLFPGPSDGKIKMDPGFRRDDDRGWTRFQG